MSPADVFENPHTKRILSAISSSNTALLDSLLAQSDSDASAPSPPRSTMLHKAAASNQPVALLHLLRMPCASPSDVDPPLLRTCANSEHLECFKALISVHPHALSFGFGHMGDIFGCAVLYGDLDFMRYAANEPAWKMDPNTADTMHRLPIEWAASASDVKVLRCLMTECGEVRVRGTNAIKEALTRGRSDILECVLEHAPEGARAVVDGWPLDEDLPCWELERRRERGWDAPNLHYAATLKKRWAVRILLEAGADPNLEDGQGRKAGDILPMDDILSEIRAKRKSSRSCSDLIQFYYLRCLSRRGDAGFES
ncbi:ankyrin repeat-containing domain protein [Roridomyces roridus]|uniref:Ankyrin repeat-containing domain protein n=1 Tax=Roridomyces roridus TaxID=1738132 RepID=A0AAD7FMM1_9AGAR|nr:ankyrin repeat-containing domain protein [Roridomyces roridus]